jgi:alkylated DNA repair dioxygenase AlkB
MIKTILDLPGADVTLYTEVDLGYDSHHILDLLHRKVPWEQRSITIYGNTIPQPRLIAWYGDHSYTYSGLRLEPTPMNPLIEDVKGVAESLSDETFNGVLLNFYKDGNSSIGMHSDDEPEFGYRPTIASLSLGAERLISFQRKDKSLPISKILLPHGSFLVMKGSTQELWKHGISKTKDDVGMRINLTFRNIVNPGN